MRLSNGHLSIAASIPSRLFSRTASVRRTCYRGYLTWCPESAHRLDAMETESANTPKRAATSPIEPEAKKQRVEAEPKTPKAEVAEEPATITNGLSEMEELERAMETASLTQHHQTRLALQRSIALVLRHDGFASATPEALESFTNHVEICE